MLVSGSVTDVAALLTVTVQDAVLPPLSLMAVIIAVPGETPRTLPTGSTRATDELLETHVTPFIAALVGLYVTDRLLAASTFSESVRLFIVIEVTGLASALTVTEHSALISPFSLVTVIVAMPPLMPVTMPLSTVATSVSEELQLKRALSQS